MVFVSNFVVDALSMGTSHWVYLGTRYAPKKAILHQMNVEDGGLDYYNYEQLLNVLLVKEVHGTNQNMYAADVFTLIASGSLRSSR